MSDLKRDIKQLIIDALGLEDISVSDIGDEQTLFGDGLGWIRSTHLSWAWRFKKPTASK